MLDKFNLRVVHCYIAGVCGNMETANIKTRGSKTTMFSPLEKCTSDIAAVCVVIILHIPEGAKDGKLLGEVTVLPSFYPY